MSEEPAQDITPFRLKRPATPSAPPSLPPGSVSPPVSATPTLPTEPVPESSPPLRRRPTLSLHKETPDPNSASAAESLPAAVSESTAATPETSVPAAPLAQPPRPETAPAAIGFKLRVGAKPPPPPPTAEPLPDLLAEMGEISGPPLIPIPSLPPIGTGATAAPFATNKPPATPPPLPPPLPSAVLTTPPLFAPVAGAAPYPNPIAPPVPPAFPPVASPANAMPVPPSPAFPKPPLSAGKPLMPGTAQFNQAKNLQRSRRPLLFFAIGICALCGGLFYFLRPNLEVVAPPPAPVVAKPKPTPPPVVVTTTAPAPVVNPPPVVVAPPSATPAVTPSVTTADTPPTAPAAPVGPPAPSSRFLRYAEGLGPTVSGVFQGNPARALIGGKVVRVGDEIDPVLGVKFVGLDVSTKHLLFEDRSGAQVRVKY